MATLVLPGLRDANVFDPVPGHDYTAIAEASWLEAQLSSRRLDELDARWVDLYQRQQDGDQWFLLHDQTDPAWPRACALRRDLAHDLDMLRVDRRVTAYACWVQCCTAYAARQCADDTTDTHPDQVWREVRGDERPPGAWPPEDRERWVEGRMATAMPWAVDELGAVLRGDDAEGA